MPAVFPLQVGKTVIGRKPSCSVVIDSPLISGVHCILRVHSPSSSSASSSDSFRITVCDCSRNGTWLRMISKDSSEPTGSSKTRKLQRTPTIIYPEDIILLLAPGHEQCAKYRFKLVVKGDGKYALQKLSSLSVMKNDNRVVPGMKRKLEGAENTKPTKIIKTMSGGVTVKAESSILSKDYKSNSDEEVERCPTCRNNFPISILPMHCPACQEASVKDIISTKQTTPGITEEMEECPKCAKLFPILDLVSHCATCLRDVEECVLVPPRDSPDMIEQCPFCSCLFPVTDLVEHCATSCGQPVPPIHSAFDGPSDDVVVIDSARVRSDGADVHIRTETATDGSDILQLEQCAFCLEDFPLCEMPAHYSTCNSRSRTKSDSDVEEHCQHCLRLFPLSKLVGHAMKCRQKNGEVGMLKSERETLERCMHCFKDFPLSVIVQHSDMCTEAMLGPTDRFKNFIPSVHDLDPITLSVLTAAQQEAVEYVTQKSRKDSENVLNQLVARVVHLGYSKKELEQTLQWIRRDAPIIIHINLDRCLRFLVKDTHYRNLFETNTGGGGTNKKAREQWEDRIFNGIYSKHKVSPFERVKYGVLNIVGDPRGVKCCSSYGDSFLQLKKVRLRTTFASADTSHANVKLSCCEHYGNVLYQYKDVELKAILSVATREKTFLRSDIITDYKEVQIHGPVCLSENVDCIVVNERHSSSPAMRELLDKFVKENNCNLLWMEKEGEVGYPSFSK